MLLAFVAMLLFSNRVLCFALRGAAQLPLPSKSQPHRLLSRTLARKSAATKRVDVTGAKEPKSSHISLAARAMKRIKQSVEPSWEAGASAEGQSKADDEIRSLFQQVYATTELVVTKNKQKTIPIDTDAVTKQAKIIMEIMNVKDFELDIEFCTERRMADLNKEWRQKAVSTDILSFPMNEFDAPEKFDRESRHNFKMQKHLGELIISPLYVQRRCDEDKESYEESMLTEEGRAAFREEVESDRGVNRRMAEVFSLQERLPMLLVHGILHLLGYDHETDPEWEAMTAKETEVLDKYYEIVRQRGSG